MENTQNTVFCLADLITEIEKQIDTVKPQWDFHTLLDPALPELLCGNFQNLKQILFILLSSLPEPLVLEVTAAKPWSGEKSIDLRLSIHGKDVQGQWKNSQVLVSKAPELSCNWSENTFNIYFTAALPDKQPPLNLKQIIADLGEENLAWQIMEQYLEIIPQKLANIEEAIYNKDSSTLHREAHSLKGAALMLHAALLKQSAQALEKKAKEGNLENCNELVDAIKKNFLEVLQYVKQIKRE